MSEFYYDLPYEPDNGSSTNQTMTISHHPQAHNQSTTRRRTLNELHASLKTSEFCNGMPAVFPLSRRAELIAFLSGNQYDLIFLQKTHLSATKKFEIPGNSTLHRDRTFGRQGHVSAGTHITGGDVLILIHSDLAFSPVSVSSLSSQDPYSDYICVKVLFSNHSPLQFLNLYFPSIGSTPSDSRTTTFSLTSFQTPMTLLPLETLMLTTQPGTDSFPQLARK